MIYQFNAIIVIKLVLFQLWPFVLIIEDGKDLSNDEDREREAGEVQVNQITVLLLDNYINWGDAFVQHDLIIKMMHLMGEIARRQLFPFSFVRRTFDLDLQEKA